MADLEGDWVPAAQILRPQGRRGELLIDLHGGADVFSPGRKLWLAKSEDGTPPFSGERVVEHAWEPTGKNAGRLVIKLMGVETISDAEALARQFLLVRSSDLPPLDEDTFRVRDLIGCSLFDGDQLAGTVIDIQFPVGADGRTRLQDAPDLLAVEPVQAEGQAGPESGPRPVPGSEQGPEPVLVPFVRAWLDEVNTRAKRIRMHLPPGLFESPDPPDAE